MNGKPSGRAECIYRAFRLIMMFENRRKVTVKDVMNEFGIRKQSAQKWIDVFSQVYPVVEIGTGRYGAKIYGLIK